MTSSAVFRAVFVAVAITVAASLVSAATPPPAKGWKTSITAPTTATAATVHISKASKAQIKVGSGIVTFSVKVKALDTADMPVNTTGNTATFTFLVNGMTRNKDFPLDFVNGKGSFKNPVTLGDAATWGTMLAAGATIELRQVRLYEVSTGELFGVSGITTK
jgi:hypothetical protein